jgi:hypothetical protein
VSPVGILLACIEEAGANVRVEPDGRIRLQPISALPPDLLAEARAHGNELAALLRTQAKARDHFSGRAIHELSQEQRGG